MQSATSRNAGDPRRHGGHEHRRRRAAPGHRARRSRRGRRGTVIDQLPRSHAEPLVLAASRAPPGTSCQAAIWSRASSSAARSSGSSRSSAAAPAPRLGTASSSSAHAVEPLGEVAHRGVALLADVGDDRGHRSDDVGGRGRAVARQQASHVGGAAEIDTSQHGERLIVPAAPHDRPPEFDAAWRGCCAGEHHQRPCPLVQPRHGSSTRSARGSPRWPSATATDARSPALGERALRRRARRVRLNRAPRTSVSATRLYGASRLPRLSGRLSGSARLELATVPFGEPSLFVRLR